MIAPARSQVVKFAVWILASGMGAAPLKCKRADLLAAHNLKLLTPAPRCWCMTELQVDVTGTYTTPFDPEQIAVDAEIRSAAGHTIRVPAFFYQEYAPNGESPGT